MAFQLRIPASCLIHVPSAFPVIFVPSIWLPQLHWHVKEGLQVNHQHLEWNFLTTNTGFSCLCAMVQSPVATYMVFPAVTLLIYGSTSSMFFEAIWEDKWRHNFIIASDHPEHHDVSLSITFWPLFTFPNLLFLMFFSLTLEWTLSLRLAPL